MPDSDIQRGCLVIADISGYTSFLAESELDHAREILDSLLEGLVEALDPPFQTAKLEGDAVFCHAPEGSTLAGQTVLEVLERAYDGFLASREIMAANTTCTCRACSRIGGLGLKFVAHHGAYARGLVGGREELTGSDVILVHRLAKNAVRAETGVESYLLATEACVEGLGLRDLLTPAAPYVEEVEHLGAVRGLVHDLDLGQAERRMAHRQDVPPEAAWLTLELDLPVSPLLAWDYLTLPEKRAIWYDADRVDEARRGRRGLGTVQHCIHGRLVFSYTVLEWHPPAFCLYEATSPLGGRQRTAIELSPSGHGAHVRFRAEAPHGATRLHTAALRVLHRLVRLQRMQRECVQRLEDLVLREQSREGRGAIRPPTPIPPAGLS